MEMAVEKTRSFGGHVDALTATRLVAIFGLEPMEDVARYAAAAAMAIQKVATRTPTRSRGGLPWLSPSNGQVPVGRHSGGHTVDADAKQAPLAALGALGDQATPGTVMVSAAAAPFLARCFELAADISLAVEPVYRLVGPAGPERGLTTRFVGRESELGLLRQRLHQAEAGQGQIVSIVGEPGIGKSRLLREFRRQVADDAAWMEGQSIAVGRTMAFHPLIDLARRAFQIDEADPKAVIIEKIELAVLHLGEDLRTVLPFLRYLLSVDPGDSTTLQLNPQLRRAGIFDGMRRVLARAAEERPLIIVWEDLHWADQASEEFVAVLGNSLAGHRILMIETSRPEYRPPATNRAFHTRLGLTALSPDDSVAMASGLLSVDALPEALQTLLLRRAEGNPFFLEELLRSCQETGMIRREGVRLVLAPKLGDSVLPDTIQDLIRARIERLGADPRQVLDVAAVVGREFPRRVVDRLAGSPAVSEQALGELQAVDLIREKTLFPELTYAFKHALTQEVAYEALPPDRRTNLHRAVGQALEALHAERLDEHCEVLARHYSKAEEWTKALEYFLMAARKAAQAFAIREALALYDQALEAAGHLDGLADGTRSSKFTGRSRPSTSWSANSTGPAPRPSRCGAGAPARRSAARSESAVPIAWAALWHATRMGRWRMRGRQSRGGADGRRRGPGSRVLHDRLRPGRNRSTDGGPRSHRSGPRAGGRARTDLSVPLSLVGRAPRELGGGIRGAAQLQAEALSSPRAQPARAAALRPLLLRVDAERPGRVRARRSRCSARGSPWPSGSATRRSTIAGCSTASAGCISSSGTSIAPSSHPPERRDGEAGAARHASECRDHARKHLSGQR